MPSNFRIKLLKQIIQWLMDGLIETVFTTETPTEAERDDVGHIEDAYYGLQDALEALEDLKCKGKMHRALWKLKKSPF
jgi:hypothetical protein